ncbi:retrovirus-related pol polyprotein from transposon TNT 1-94 [Tanacetum coccineum]
MNDKSCETNSAKDVKALDSKNLELTYHVTALLEQNERSIAEIKKVKQHYKELYDSIKITRAHNNEKTSSLLNEIESLKAQLKSKVSCVISDSVKPKVLAPGMYAIDVVPIPPRLKKNRNAHLDYINHLKESVETIREIVEEARIAKPLDNELNSSCKYMKLSQELLEYVIGVRSATEASGSKPKSNTKNNRIMHAKSENKKNVEDHPRTNKYRWTKVNRVDSSISSKLVVVQVILCVISRIYYVEGLGHNLFTVRQFYDSDLEIAFRKHSCFVRNMDGVDLLHGSHSTNLYTISVDEMLKSSPICLLSKASKNKSWLWHRRLNHLNFGTINDLA